MIKSILEIGHAGGLGGWVDAFVCVSYKNWFDQYVLLKIHDCLWHVRSTSGWPRSARCGGQDCAELQNCTRMHRYKMYRIATLCISAGQS